MTTHLLFEQMPPFLNEHILGPSAQLGSVATPEVWESRRLVL